MDSVRIYILMALHMQVTITRERSKAMGNKRGQMVPSTTVIGVITKSMGTVHISGQIVVNTKENGKMGLEYTYGKVVEGMNASTRFIQNMVLAYTHGRLPADTEDNG